MDLNILFPVKNLRCVTYHTNLNFVVYNLQKTTTTNKQKDNPITSTVRQLKQNPPCIIQLLNFSPTRPRQQEMEVVTVEEGGTIDLFCNLEGANRTDSVSVPSGSDVERKLIRLAQNRTSMEPLFLYFDFFLNKCNQLNISL